MKLGMDYTFSFVLGEHLHFKTSVTDLHNDRTVLSSLSESLLGISNSKSDVTRI